MSPQNENSVLPHYTGNERPTHLYTANELRAEGLQPMPQTPVAIWHSTGPNRSSISGLFDRRTAVPMAGPTGP